MLIKMIISEISLDILSKNSKDGQFEDGLREH